MNQYGINSKRTKIVATLGPSSQQRETIREMIISGLNVARINFSHGEHETHGQVIDIVREEAEKAGTVIAILADIQGPKIRLGKVAEPISVEKGDRVEFTLEEVDGSEGRVNLPHPEFIKDVHNGESVLYGDGELEFEVVEKRSQSLVVKAQMKGLIESRKGIMAPQSRLSMPAITEKGQARYSICTHQAT